jgi:hypothetical protein
VVAMFDNRSGRNEQSLQRNFHRCFLPSFGSFGQAVSEEKILKKSANQKQELPVAAFIFFVFCVIFCGPLFIFLFSV